MVRRDVVIPTFGLVLVRVTVGMLLFGSGRGLFGNPPPDGPRVADLVGESAPDLPGPLSWWGRVVLLENPDAIAFLWPWVLTITGAALALGFLTRPMGIVASLALLHAALFGRPEMALLHVALAVMALACALSQAGRLLGVDGALGDSLPTGVTWARRG